MVQAFRRTIWESLFPQHKVQIPASFLVLYTSALMSRISFLRTCPNFLKVQGLLSEREGGFLCVCVSTVHNFQQKEIWKIRCVCFYGCFSFTPALTHYGRLVLEYSSDDCCPLLHGPCGPCLSHWTFSRVGEAHLQVSAQ